MFLSALDALKQAEFAIQHAFKAHGVNVKWLAWPQTWPNTSCGFGGIAGQAFSEAQTVIVTGEAPGVWVYHRGRYAYTVEQPTDAFWELCGKQQLPGQASWTRDKAVRVTLDAKAK